MANKSRHIELLAPARNADFGIEAVNHGADAVYIGGPDFGARAKAPNSVDEIERLVRHAHRYHAKVFVALNTIFHDDELEAVRSLTYKLYDAGVDALIVQDMGLLEVDIPPIELHASTQTDIRTVEKAVFLDQVGFSKLILARELDLNMIRAISQSTSCDLEFFVHGALCVAFSGQCFISHAHTGRSANRGECSQECRLPYTLEDPKGRILAKDKHLLSMKDNDQASNLRALISAGVNSFKIEGRYKDLPYVKNVTAYYRQLLDEILNENLEYVRSSSGSCTYSFVPQPEKTFNRSTTDYFVNGRKSDIGAFDTPKFAGEELGKVIRVGKDYLEIDSTISLNNGDGVCFFDVHKELVGMRINTVKDNRLYPNEMPLDIRKNMTVFRNRDQAFMRLLEKDSSIRRMEVVMNMSEYDEGVVLTVTDEDGFKASVKHGYQKILAQNIDNAEENLRENLAKLGNTDFVAKRIEIDFRQPWFVPASVVNSMRREAIEQLTLSRIEGYPRPRRKTPSGIVPSYPDDVLTYLANVYNEKARSFYHKHGVKAVAMAYEANQEVNEVPLMITKHCLRFSHGLCPKEAKGVVGVQGTVTAEPMTLISGNERFTLIFDCKPCEMHVMGKLRKSVITNYPSQPIQFIKR